MDDEYIVRWVFKQITPDGVAWHEGGDAFDDLTTAERWFTQLKKDPDIIEARILWGDVDIKNYRRM